MRRYKAASGERWCGMEDWHWRPNPFDPKVFLQSFEFGHDALGMEACSASIAESDCTKKLQAVMHLGVW